MATYRATLIEAERHRITLPRHGGMRVAVGYPNEYRVAMSSLSFQWVVELTAMQEDTAVERFFADQELAGTSLESGRSLGDFDIVALSCSFELDAVNVLRVMEAAGIPCRRRERGPRFPLVVLGGAVASINPLPLAPAVDVFVLGAAERLWPPLLDLAREYDRSGLLCELARRDGYFVPEHHLDERNEPTGRLRRLEKRDVHMADADMVPHSHAVTPLTEYRDRGLIEMSRGCPEKCQYCWVSHNYGRLRCYPKEAILDRVRLLGSLTRRVGFVATAVGDHPDLPEILGECRSLGMEVALSSLRIPAMVRDVLQPLADSGARSVTIAPETGTDRLRHDLNKPITNDRILEAVETAQNCHIPNIKMYFIVGLPGETDDDVRGIADLLRATSEIVRGQGKERGRVGNVHAGVSILVPKPYTPYQSESMLTARETGRRIDLLWNGLRNLDNLKFNRPSYREALWQGFLSRGDCRAFEVLERVAAGDKLTRVLAARRPDIESVALARADRKPVWQFISSAPTARARISDP